VNQGNAESEETGEDSKKKVVTVLSLTDSQIRVCKTGFLVMCGGLERERRDKGETKKIVTSTILTEQSSPECIQV
jgi:hypothetical protein